MDKQTIQKMIDTSITKAKSFIGQYKVDTPLDANQVVPKKYVDTIATSADFSVSDGVTTVHPVSSIVFLNGATISGGSGIANVSILSSGGGSPTSPGGSNTNIQFNDSGSFGGSDNLTWNKGTYTITGPTDTNSVLTITAGNVVLQSTDNSLVSAGSGATLIASDNSWDAQMQGGNASADSVMAGNVVLTTGHGTTTGGIDHIGEFAGGLNLYQQGFSVARQEYVFQTSTNSNTPTSVFQRKLSDCNFTVGLGGLIKIHATVQCTDPTHQATYIKTATIRANGSIMSLVGSQDDYVNETDAAWDIVPSISGTSPSSYFRLIGTGQNSTITTFRGVVTIYR